MANLNVVQSTAANGTVTPATVALAGVTATDLLLCVIACVGSTATSIATPTGDTWSVINNTAGAGATQPSLGLFFLRNAGAGAHTPSSVLTGTLTGWLIVVIEINNTFAAQLVQNGAVAGSTATLPASGIFSQSLGQMTYNEMAVYAVVRTGATTLATSPVSGLNNWAPPGYPLGASQWSASIQPQANVQGLSLDVFVGAANNNSCPMPSSGGTLSAAVNNVAAGGILTASFTNPSAGIFTNISGGEGQIVSPFFQGMVGG